MSRGSLGLLPRCLWSRSRSLLLKKINPFLLNNLSLLRLINTILVVWIAYVKRQPGIATLVSLINVKVTAAKNKKKFCSITGVYFGRFTPNYVCGRLILRGSLGLLPMCLWSRSMSLLLKIENQLALNNLNLLRLIDAILGLWVTYVMRQLGIATQVSVVKVKVTVAKNLKWFPFNILCFFWLIGALLGL